MEVVHESFQRRLDEFLGGRDDNIYTKTDRMIFERDTVNRFLLFSNKHEIKVRSSAENIEMFCDFIEIVSLQYQVRFFESILQKY